LKDASASVIYGARAANGVILITTKREKARRCQSPTTQSGSADTGSLFRWPAPASMFPFIMKPLIRQSRFSEFSAAAINYPCAELPRCQMVNQVDAISDPILFFNPITSHFQEVKEKQDTQYQELTISRRNNQSSDYADTPEE